MPTATPPRRVIPKDSFGKVFSTFKTGVFHDAVRGPGSKSIRSIAWSPTGSLVATGSSTLRVWNPERANVRYSTELRGHTSQIEGVAFNPAKEGELATCSSDGTVRFWDVRAKARVASLDVGGKAISLSWSADGRVCLVGRTDNTLVPVSVPAMAAVPSSNPSNHTASSTSPLDTYKMLPAHREALQTDGTCFSHATDTDDLNLFLTHGDGTVQIVSYPSWEPLYTLNGHTSPCRSVKLSPTGRYLAVGGGDALISLWDTTDWICRRTVSGAQSGPVTDISWSWDGRFIVGACHESGWASGLEIYHAESGESVFSSSGGPGSANVGIGAVAWHPSRYALAYSALQAPGSSDSGGLRIIGTGLSH
ncbi:hypothetical protein KEM52_000495 [Ascosphaera acerosa]|nr:hypothetical protein KEM52_000495 [Ascosphaera acerosa]